MARYRQADNERYIEADNGFGWTRRRASATSVERNRYVTTVFGLSYELEKRHRSPGDTPDTGWYLYSLNDTYFFGESCGLTLLTAVDAASEMIAKADLRYPDDRRQP
jgi:hypothetical protein